MAGFRARSCIRRVLEREDRAGGVTPVRIARRGLEEPEVPVRRLDPDLRSGDRLTLGAADGSDDARPTLESDLACDAALSDRNLELQVGDREAGMADDQRPRSRHHVRRRSPSVRIGAHPSAGEPGRGLARFAQGDLRGFDRLGLGVDHGDEELDRRVERDPDVVSREQMIALEAREPGALHDELPEPVARRESEGAVLARGRRGQDGERALGLVSDEPARRKARPELAARFRHGSPRALGHGPGDEPGVARDGFDSALEHGDGFPGRRERGGRLGPLALVNLRCALDRFPRSSADITDDS
jgi:hypothetical protein